MKDKLDALEICPKCGSDACYKTPLNENKNRYTCFGCGFYTTDLMVQGEFDFESYEETLPELFKDMKVSDHNGNIWYPMTINLPEKGTVFPMGKSISDWEWASVRVKEVSDEEKEKFKIPGSKESYNYKTDMSTLQKYNRTDFIEALDYIGFFE